MTNEKINAIKKRLLGHPLFPKVKDRAILAGWIFGLILIAGITWSLTQPARDRSLQRAVNQILEQSGDYRIITEPVSPVDFADSRTGRYFSMDGASRAFVFTMIAEGSFFPCLAVIGADGRIEEFIALNSHGKRIFESISPRVLALYARRIEGRYHEPSP